MFQINNQNLETFYPSYHILIYKELLVSKQSDCPFAHLASNFHRAKLTLSSPFYKNQEQSFKLFLIFFKHFYAIKNAFLYFTIFFEIVSTIISIVDNL